jgi:hypothetical protein
MQKALERTRKFNAKGDLIEESFSIGPIIPWAIVAIIALFAGKALVNIPPSFWTLFGK